MLSWSERFLKSDIKLSMKLYSCTKFVKVFLALIILYGYFSDAEWWGDVLVIGVVITLVMPMGFFDVFIQRLLEHNTQTLEDRQKLNAEEANEHFSVLYKALGKAPDSSS